MTSGTRRQQERRRSVLMLPTFCNDPDYCAQHHGRASAERNQTMRRLVTSLETWIFTSCSRRSRHRRGSTRSSTTTTLLPLRYGSSTRPWAPSRRCPPVEGRTRSAQNLRPSPAAADKEPRLALRPSASPSRIRWHSRSCRIASGEQGFDLNGAGRPVRPVMQSSSTAHNSRSAVPS